MSRVVDFLPKFYRKVLFGIVGITSLVIILIVGQTLINHSQSWHYKFSSQIGEFEIATLRENNINVLKKSPNCILVTNRSSSVSCLDPITGKITWQNWLPEAVSTTSFYSLKYQMFAIITANGGLVGIDEKSGQTKWNFVNPQNTHWERVQMDEAQEKIMALDRHNSFFVLDFSSGKIAWSVIEAQINEKNLNYIPKGSLYQSNNLIILTNLKTGTIKAFAKNSGDNLWQRNDAKKDISGFISLDNGAVWYESDYGTLNKVNSKTGVQTISIAIPINDDISSIPGLIQIYNNNERIIKWYGSSSGELLRQVTLPGKIKRIWSEQGLFAIMYFGPYQEKLAKINPKTGEIIWLSENLGVIRDTSQSTDSITIISLYGMVVWLDPKTGQTQAKTNVQGEPRFIFNDPSQPTQFWINVAHSGNYDNNPDVNDILLFSQPGKLIKTWQNLPYDVSSGLLDKDKLWLIHQDMHQLMALNQNSWSSTKVIERPVIKPLTILTKLKTNLDFLWLTPKNLPTTAKTESTFRGCVVSWSIKPNDKTKQLLFNNPNLNLWKDIKISAKTETDAGQKTSVSGFYYQNYEWRAILRLPDDSAGKLLNWQVSFKVAGKTLTESGKILTPVSCKTNSLSLQTLPKKLVDSSGNDFWGIGLQDIMFDINEEGSVLDQWALGDTATPPTSLVEINYVDSRTYLENYRKSGFNFFRLGFDNFSYQLFHQLDKNDFKASPVNSIMTDELLTQLHQNNYYVIMSIFGFKPVMDLTNMPAYLDYVIARYSPWIDIWELSNEAWPNDDWVKFVTNYIKTHDPLKHPVTISWERRLSPEIDLTSIHYYWNDLWQEKGDDFVFKLRTAAFSQKPVIVSEIGNTGASWDPESVDRLRWKSWISAWMKVPIIAWNQSRTIFNNPDNANVFIGTSEKDQIKVLSQWLVTHQAEKFQPIDSLMLPFTGCYGMTNQIDKIMFYCLNHELEGQKRAVVLNLTDWSKPARIDLTNIKNWQASWFDPVTGLETNNTNQADNILTLPDFKTDIVGIITLIKN